MENITKHIDTLIRRHDYVIIPGLGGFMIQKQSAIIEQDKIIPPKSVVSFNHLMNVSDGLLAIELSRSEHISYRDAMVKLSEYSEALLEKLDNGEKVNIAQLGQLRRDDEAKLVFAPNEETQLIPNNFGLKNLHYSVRMLIGEQKENSRKVIQITLPASKSVIKYAAVAVLAVGLFFSAPKIGETYKNLSSFGGFRFWSNSDKGMVNDETVAPLQETIEPTIIQEVEIVKTHHVIVGAMAAEKDANQFCQNLKDSGYAEAHVLDPIKTYRIAIQSFETKNEAISYMTELRTANNGFAEAWVLSE